MKQSIFGRMAQLAKANINSLLDQAEDPQKMLDQMVRDYTNNIAEAEAAVAQTIGNLRMLQDDYNEDIKNAHGLGQQGPGRVPQSRRVPRRRQHRRRPEIRQPGQGRPAAPDVRRRTRPRPPSRISHPSPRSWTSSRTAWTR